MGRRALDRRRKVNDNRERVTALTHALRGDFEKIAFVLDVLTEAIGRDLVNEIAAKRVSDAEAELRAAEAKKFKEEATP